MSKSADEIARRTGPLHRVLGITAAASAEEVKLALQRATLDEQTQRAGAHLVDPDYREAYEAAVMASRLGAVMVVPPDQREEVLRFTALMGLRLQPVENETDKYRVFIEGGDPSWSQKAHDPLSDREVESNPPPPTATSEITREPRLSGQFGGGLLGTLRTSLSAQIIAGVLLVGILGLFAWITAPRPIPPTAEEQAREEMREVLAMASEAIAELRDHKADLDSAGQLTIGPGHRWHDVDAEPPPTQVAAWIGARDKGDGRVLFAYNQIAETAFVLEQRLVRFTETYEQIARKSASGDGTLLLGQAEQLLGEIGELAQSITRCTTDLRALHEHP